MTGRSTHRMRDGEQGFSLVELLVAIVLMGVVGSVMLGGVVRSLNVTAEATTRVDALTALQQAVERMSRNLRAADPVIAASATAVTVNVYDDVTRRRITYTHSGATVTEAVQTFPNHITVTPTSTTTRTAIDELDQGVTPVFVYYAGDGTAWDGVDAGDIARIEVRLRHAVDRGDPIQLSSSAFVRNTVE